MTLTQNTLFSRPVYFHTCAQEEHLVVPIGSHHLVHGHRCVFVVSVGPDHQGSPPHWVDGVEHDRMVPYEGHDVIWELLCCLDVRCEGSTRTLEEQKKVKPQVSCFRQMLKNGAPQGSMLGPLFFHIYLFLTSICDFLKDVSIFF